VSIIAHFAAGVSFVLVLAIVCEVIDVVTA
jgi:hypothetical protein